MASENLSSSVEFRVTSKYTKATTVGTSTDDLGQDGKFSKTLAFGANTNQGEAQVKIYADELAAGSVAVDLQALTDEFGVAKVLTKIKTLMVIVEADSADDVTITADVTNPAPPFGASDVVTVPIDGAFAWHSGTGLTVDASNKDFVLAGAAAGAFKATVIILGTVS